MSALESLRSEIESVESVIDSAITFIAGIENRLREALMGRDTNIEVGQLADELASSRVKLATAIAQNTNAEEDSDHNFDPAPIGEQAPADDTTQQDEGDALAGDEGNSGDESGGGFEGSGDSEDSGSSLSTESEESAPAEEAYAGEGGGPAEGDAVAGESLTGEGGEDSQPAAEGEASADSADENGQTEA